MTIFRIGLWAAIAVLGGYLAWSTVNWTLNDRAGGMSKMAGADVGGPFTATRADGTKITRKDMLGRPHIIFFGFTHCPDVCHTTLYEAGQWLNALGPDGDKVDAYFVSVDPERDTTTILAEYLTSFDPRISGITGTPEQVADIVKSWRVFVKNGEKDEDGSYDVQHTASTFLMDTKGEFFGTIAYGESADTAVKKLKRLLKSS